MDNKQIGAGIAILLGGIVFGYFLSNRTSQNKTSEIHSVRFAPVDPAVEQTKPEKSQDAIANPKDSTDGTNTKESDDCPPSQTPARQLRRRSFSIGHNAASLNSPSLDNSNARPSVSFRPRSRSQSIDSGDDHVDTNAEDTGNNRSLRRRSYSMSQSRGLGGRSSVTSCSIDPAELQLALSESASALISVDESEDATVRAIVQAVEKPHVQFDPSAVEVRLEKLWSLDAEFGAERSPFNVYLEEIVSDRYCLIGGMQCLRDELQLTFTKTDFCRAEDSSFTDVHSCCADVTIPSVLCTVAHTNCGDRICQAATCLYQQMVASRFASISELGDIKPELFNPTGGGTDDGATLAHVTVGHMFHTDLKNFIYDGNPKSFALVNIDINTHCGKLIVGEEEILCERRAPMKGLRLFFGSARESIWRDARSACGAVYGCLNSFNSDNAVHRRLRADLGEANYELLSTEQLLADDGTPITYLVAAAIIAIRGMLNTAKALTKELGERGVGSCTASVTINHATIGEPDFILYLARCTVFRGEITVQGLGVDAKKYAGSVDESGLITLHYDGHDCDQYKPCYLTAETIDSWNT